MGRDKALLPLPGDQQVTFIEHLAKLLTSLCSEVVLVARDAAQSEHYHAHALPGLRIVNDQIPDIGPLMGLYSGLRAVQSSHALVTAVDMPFVQAAMLTFLLAQPRDEAALIPVVHDIPQVLLAVYPRSILPTIEERLHAGRRDPRSLLEVAPVRYIEEARLREIDPELRSFVNVNTPEELANL
jgi:molybdopterin-guanine dinucleotide biosynthesis protein A